VNAKFAKTLLVVSMGAFAIAANAQNNTPRDNPAGTSTNNTTQQGTSTGTTPSTAPSGSMMNNGMSNGGTMKYRALNDADMKSYKSGWAACGKMNGGDQTACRTKFGSTWSQVDPKCQKVSGMELDNCLKGADHGQ
jgi:hypothetical protein